MAETAASGARGLEGVVAARTRMSHVDGEKGVLIIGGYELSELAGHVTFEEAAHLLWRGALPGRAELATLRAEMAALRRLPESTMQVLYSARGALPIDALRMACATLSLDLGVDGEISREADLARARMLTARFPTAVAPRPDLAHAANFLYMVHGSEPDPVVAKALDTYWVT